MNRYFLTRIEVEGFRGINNSGDPLDLRLKSSCVNSVFAANGLGKSSVFEALHYAINRTVPKLAALHSSEQADDYFANRFHPTGDAVIQLTLQPDDGSEPTVVRVRRSSDGIRTVDSPSGRADPEKLLESLGGDLTLLDHQTFLSFVEDTPLKRGRSFSSLLGLGRLSEFRQALEMLAHGRNLKTDLGIGEMQAKVETLEAGARQGEERTRTLLKELTGQDASQPIDYSAISEAAGGSLEGIELIRQHVKDTPFEKVSFEDIEKTIKDAEASDKRDRLKAVIAARAVLKELPPDPADLESQTGLRQQIEARDAALAETRGPLFQQLYQSLNAIFESGDWPNHQQCPACEHDQGCPLDEVIRGHLQHYEAAVELQSKISDSWAAASWGQRLRSLEGNNSIGVPLDDRKYNDLNAALRSPGATVDTLEEAVSTLAKLDELRTKKLDDLADEQASLEKHLPPSLVELTKKVEVGRQLQQAISTQLNRITDRRRFKLQLVAREKWASFVGYAATAFAQAEVALSTAQTAAIEGQYRNTYEQVTANDQVVPVLKKADGSEALLLRLEKFYGLSDVSAATLLQESYRNALAISLFLSMAVKTKKAARFIVLDDVTSSFDAGHQFNLMEVIRTKLAYPANPDGPQVILLSHDGLLEKYFDQRGNQTDWNHQKLQGLPPVGFVSSNRQSETRLRDAAESFLNAGQVKEAEPLVRQYLEYRLLEVIRRVRIPVPIDFSIRDDRRMVQNCIDAINAAVELRRDAGSLILTGSQVSDLDTLHVPALVSNWVAHYQTGVGASVTPYVYLGVLDTIDRFTDCFKYSCHCSGSTQDRYYRDLATKHCGC